MEKIKIDQFLEYKFLSGLSANPSQNKFAFAVAQAKLEKNEYSYDLYLDDGAKRSKLFDMKKNSGFIWETDETILFSYAKNKKEEKLQKESNSIYYRYSIQAKKAEKAYEFPFSATILEIISSNELLLSSSLNADEHHLYKANKEDRKKLLDQAKKQALYENIQEIPFYFNGKGFTANKRNQLFIYNISSKEYTPLVDLDFSVEITRLSEDKKTLYYTGQQMTGVRSLTSQIYKYDLEKRSNEHLLDNDKFAINGLFIVSGQIIVAAADMKDFGLNQNNDFYILKNKKLNLLKIYGQALGNSVGTDCKLGGSKNSLVYKDKLYFISTIDDHTELNTLDLKGNLEIVYAFDGSIDGIEFSNNQLYFIAMHKQKLQELYQIDFDSQKQTQISSFNRKVLSKKYVAVPKEVILKSKSHTVKGWVLLPKDYDLTKNYPAIMDIHGGPKTVYGKIFYHEMQYWANEGYIVFFANPRGSDGKGDGFADIRGKYGTIDYDDLMGFADLVMKKYPAIDQSRVFVTGGSYGGFMTNWIVGHTNRFKAAATQRSISNWLSFHGTSDIGFYFSKDQTNGHPNVDTELLWTQSPMKYAMSIETPLLFIHSDQDYRCPIEQAMQLFTIIKEKGVTTKLVWFKGETHELSRSGKPQARIKRLTEITSWFDQYK
jgi:dipeptidyl aminopeptidase/acylaminoacyl peptidase